MTLSWSQHHAHCPEFYCIIVIAEDRRGYLAAYIKQTVCAAIRRAVESDSLGSHYRRRVVSYDPTTYATSFQWPPLWHVDADQDARTSCCRDVSRLLICFDHSQSKVTLQSESLEWHDAATQILKFCVTTAALKFSLRLASRWNSLMMMMMMI